MLFNSGEFVFAFLPAAVIGFFLLGAVGQRWALLWLIGVSIFFYAWWRPLNVFIIAPSILINFAIARVIELLNGSGTRPEVTRLVLVLGIAFNIAFLGFFKYVDFLSGSINDAFGTNLILLHVILPLGISFITFQK